MSRAMPERQTLTLPDGEFDAYLFDCDGTIADSLPLHFRAWNEALARWGCRFEADLFSAWSGIPIAKTVEMLNEKYSLHMPVAEVVGIRDEAYHRLLPQVRPVAVTLPYIEHGFGRLPLAVVSGSSRASVRRTLEALHLSDRFQKIIGAEDYRQGKPDPEPFLVAAERLGVRPDACLVFEDADLGIEAARRAGMRWVRVPAQSRVDEPG
jgi:beta-phosphoglucomutase-like phosphatase (HAD superfamily)